MRYVQYTEEEKAKSKTQKKKKQKAEQKKRTCNQEGGWFGGMCEGDSCSVVVPQQHHSRTTERDIQSCELRVMELQEEIRQLKEMINLMSQRHEQPQIQKPPQIQQPHDKRTKLLQKKSDLDRLKRAGGQHAEEQGIFLENEIAKLQNEIRSVQWGHANKKKIPPLHDHYSHHNW